MDQSLGLIYESILINEMEDRVISYIKDHEDKLLPFDNIFGDKLRIVVPHVSSDMIDEIISTIKTVKDFAGFDSATGEVIRKIKLDPKYGQGEEKEQRINLGKAIQSLKISDEKKKKLLDWYAKYKDSISSMDMDFDEGSEYAIILSRAPVDVVRMSDHRNISSCHSSGGSYFNCAVQEAINGGAIAYLVHFDSLKGYLESDDFQEDDLFGDGDRNIRGLEAPLARLRVRRVEGPNGDLALPENRIYGDSNIPDFYSSLRDFIQTKQNLDLDKVHSDLEDAYENRDWAVRGGSYMDNDTAALLNRYFGLSSDAEKRFNYTHAISNSRDDERSEPNHGRITNRLEEEAREIYARYRNRYTYANVWMDIDDDGEEPYISTSASITFNLENFGLSEDFELSVDDDYDFKKMKNSGDGWADFCEGLETAIDRHSSRLTIMGFEATAEKLVVRLDPDEGGYMRESETLDNFMDDVWDVDKSYDEILEMLEGTLEEAGFIVGVSGDEYSRYLEYKTEDDLEWWNHFEIEGDTQKTVKFTLLPTVLIRSKNYVSHPEFERTLSNVLYHVGGYVRLALVKMLKDTYKAPAKSNEEQTTFKSFFESYMGEGSDLLDFALISRIVPNHNFQDLELRSFELMPSSCDNATFEMIDFLDGMYKHVINLYAYVCYTKLEQYYTQEEYLPSVQSYKPSNLEQLRRLYGKYLS